MSDFGIAIITETGDLIVNEDDEVLLFDAAPVPADTSVPTVRHVLPSRIRLGSLTFTRSYGDGTFTFDVSCPQTAVKLVPTVSAGTDARTICGRTIRSVRRTTWELTGRAISDFSDPAGFVRFAYEQAGQWLAFSWQPTPTSAWWEGTVRVRPVEVGGQVGSRLLVDWAWPLQGAPRRVVAVTGPIG